MWKEIKILSVISENLKSVIIEKTQEKITDAKLKLNEETRNLMSDALEDLEICTDYAANDDVTEGVLIWKEVCRGEKSCTEFVEVRNNWY